MPTPAATGSARHLRALPAALALAVALAGAFAPAAAGKRIRTLSNERTVTRWAFVTHRTIARVAPLRRARAIALLHTRTGDRTPEVVVALARIRYPSGATWVRVRLPVKPNGTTGWVPRWALGPLYTDRTLFVINRNRLRATLFVRGRPRWRAPVGIGRPEAPTPSGRSYVRERLVPPNKHTLYGVFAFGLSAHSPTLSDWPGGAFIGVHGTNEPRLIPGRISHGCVRVRNAQIRKLRRLMPLGTPVIVI